MSVKYRWSVGQVSVKYRWSIGHVSVKYRSCIGQVSVMYRSSIGRESVKYRSSVGQVSVKCRSSIGQVSVKYRSSIGHVSVEYRWFKTISVDTFIGRLSADISVDYRPIVGRLSTDNRPIADLYSVDNRPIYRPMYRSPIVHMYRLNWGMLLCEPASLRAWAFFDEPEPFFASPESSRQKHLNMDIVPFYGLLKDHVAKSNTKEQRPCSNKTACNFKK